MLVQSVILILIASNLHVSNAACSHTVEALKSLEEKISSLTELISNSVCTLRPSPTHKNIDGARWTRFWWYEGTGWPPHETDVLGGKFNISFYL